MLGKTHIAIGLASSLIIVPPQNLPELAAGVGAAVTGSLLPDLDVRTSEAHRAAEKVIWIGILAAVVLKLTDDYWFPAMNLLMTGNQILMRKLAAAAVFFGICAAGKSMPHRSFMHSITAMLILTACVSVFLPVAAPSFLTAFLSHLSIDLLNRKGEQLLYPIPAHFSLGVCSSSGLTNACLFWIGTVLAAGQIAWSAFGILF